MTVFSGSIRGYRVPALFMVPALVAVSIKNFSIGLVIGLCQGRF